MPAIGQNIKGWYILKRQLASGGFGQVWLAEDNNTGKEVAIKFALDPLLTQKDKDDFVNEVFLTRNVSVHQNIVTVIDGGIENSDPFMVMEYIPGGSLETKRGSQLGFQDVGSYISDAARGLQYVHNNRIIHNDVKLENLFFGSKGEILVGDFGTSKLLPAKDSSISLVGSLRGTPEYVAPEVFRRILRRESDQFSLAVCAYELLTGNYPFVKGGLDLVAGIALKPPPISTYRRGVPQQVDRVFEKALAKDPDMRYRHIQEFSDALKDALKPQAVAPPIIQPRPINNPPTLPSQAPPQGAPQKLMIPPPVQKPNPVNNPILSQAPGQQQQMILPPRSQSGISSSLNPTDALVLSITIPIIIGAIIGSILYFVGISVGNYVTGISAIVVVFCLFGGGGFLVTKITHKHLSGAITGVVGTIVVVFDSAMISHASLEQLIVASILGGGLYSLSSFLGGLLALWLNSSVQQQQRQPRSPRVAKGHQRRTTFSLRKVARFMVGVLAIPTAIATLLPSSVPLIGALLGIAKGPLILLLLLLLFIFYKLR